VRAAWSVLLCAVLAAGCSGAPEEPPPAPAPLPAESLADKTPAEEPAAFARVRLAPEAEERITLGRTTRSVLWGKREAGPVRRPLNDDGTLTVRAGEDFTWRDGDYAIQVFARPTRLSLPYPEELGTEYGYARREDFENGVAHVHLFEGAPPAPEAYVRIRPVHAETYTWTSPAVEVAAGATLHAAAGLLDDWAPGRFDAFEFTIEAVAEDGTVHPLDVPVPSTAADNGWHPFTIGVDLLAGTRCRFRFAARNRDGARRDDSVIPLWSTASLRAPSTAETRPNLILVSLDTLRADRMSLHGYPRTTTPHLEAFANEAVVFDRAISPSTWTTPSHGSMFTGKLPWEHGAGSWYQGWLLGEDHLTIAELLRDAGYATAAYTEGGLVGGVMGFAQGFDQYDDGPAVAGDRSGVADVTFARAWEWIASQSSSPFFLFLHTFEIHAPYCSPEPEGIAFVDKNNAFPNCVDEPDIDSEPLGQHASDLYDGGIQYTDRLLGRFFGLLSESGLLENTVVIVTSDHGEEFHEHGKYGHNNHIYPEVIHVPLLVRLPGEDPPSGRIDRLVSTRDLHATLGALAGVDAAKLHPGAHSLVPFLGGGGEYPREAVFSHMPMWDPEYAQEHDILHEFSYYSLWGEHGRFMIDDEAWVAQQVGKRVAGDIAEWEEEAYAYPEDPGDRNNLADNLPQALKALREGLLQRLERDGRLVHRIGSEAVGASGVSQETMDEMDALGYL